jgi:hypothetical protein
VTAGQKGVGSRFGVVLGILGLLLAGCSKGRPGEPVSSTPVKPPSPSAASAQPVQTLLDPPDPCDLIEPAKLPELKQIGSKAPKKEPGSLLQKCTWEVDQGHQGASIVRVAVGDVRPRTTAQVPWDVDLQDRDCPEEVTSAAGKFCQSTDRHGIEIVRQNLYVTITWATTAISRTRPEAERVRRENRLSKQLAEQALTRLGEQR